MSLSNLRSWRGRIKMSEVRWRLVVDEIYENFNKMTDDIETIKTDMQDVREDLTSIIDAQYELDKKVNILLHKFDDVIY